MCSICFPVCLSHSINAVLSPLGAREQRVGVEIQFVVEEWEDPVVQRSAVQMLSW